MKTIKQLEEEIKEITSRYNPQDVPLILGNKVLELEATLTQTQKISKLIEKKIKVRKSSIRFIVSDYEEIFSINDLNEILSKIRGDGK